MPMLTTLRIGLPVWPVHSPERTRSAKALIRSSVSCTCLTTSTPVDDQRALARHPQRHVEHGAVLGDVDVLAGEHRFATLLDAALAGQLGRAASASRRRPGSWRSRGGGRRRRRRGARPARGRRRRARAGACPRSRRSARSSAVQASPSRSGGRLRSPGSSQRAAARDSIVPSISSHDLAKLVLALLLKRGRQRVEIDPGRARTPPAPASASPPSAGSGSPTSPWSAKASRVGSGIVLTCQGRGERLYVEDVGGFRDPWYRCWRRAAAAAARPRSASRCMRVGVEQLAVGGVGAACRSPSRAGCAAPPAPSRRPRRPSG